MTPKQPGQPSSTPDCTQTTVPPSAPPTPAPPPVTNPIITYPIGTIIHKKFTKNTMKVKSFNTTSRMPFTK